MAPRPPMTTLNGAANRKNERAYTMHTPRKASDATVVNVMFNTTGTRECSSQLHMSRYRATRSPMAPSTLTLNGAAETCASQLEVSRHRATRSPMAPRPPMPTLNGAANINMKYTHWITARVMLLCTAQCQVGTRTLAHASVIIL